LLQYLVGQQQVAVVDGVERSAENGDPGQPASPLLPIGARVGRRSGAER
jgi:hypothetical protein